MGYIPVQPDHLLLYAVFLARRFKAASVRSCPNIIGILHKEFGLPFMACFGNPTFLPVSPTSFDPRKQPTRADFKIFPWGVLITSRWSKTIQFRERVVEIHFPAFRALLIMSKGGHRQRTSLYGLGFSRSSLVGWTPACSSFSLWIFCFSSAQSFCVARLWPKAFRGAPLSQRWGIICLPTRCSLWTDWGSRRLALRHHSHLFNHAFDSLPSFRKHAILRHNPLHPPR